MDQLTVKAVVFVTDTESALVTVTEYGPVVCEPGIVRVNVIRVAVTAVTTGVIVAEPYVNTTEG